MYISCITFCTEAMYINLHFNKTLKVLILVCLSFDVKILQTEWLKQLEINFVTALEARSL